MKVAEISITVRHSATIYNFLNNINCSALESNFWSLLSQLCTLFYPFKLPDSDVYEIIQANHKVSKYTEGHVSLLLEMCVN